MMGVEDGCGVRRWEGRGGVRVSYWLATMDVKGMGSTSAAAAPVAALVGAVAGARATVRKNLWLIRHAESMANVAHKYPTLSQKDLVNTRLSEDGRAQADKVQGPVDLLIVSPLRRTMETYACSKLKVGRLFTSELVREWRAYGPPGDLELETPRQETADELRARVRATVDLLRAQPEQNIGILSHGVFLAELARHVQRPLRASMANAEVIHLPSTTLP